MQPSNFPALNLGHCDFTVHYFTISLLPTGVPYSVRGTARSCVAKRNVLYRMASFFTNIRERPDISASGLG
eukprot:2821588-Prymnesium_polylepis.2